MHREADTPVYTCNSLPPCWRMDPMSTPGPCSSCRHASDHFDAGETRPASCGQAATPLPSKQRATTPPPPPPPHAEPLVGARCYPRHQACLESTLAAQGGVVACSTSRVEAARAGGRRCKGVERNGLLWRGCGAVKARSREGEKLRGGPILLWSSNMPMPFQESGERRFGARVDMSVVPKQALMARSWGGLGACCPISRRVRLRSAPTCSHPTRRGGWVSSKYLA